MGSSDPMIINTGSCNSVARTSVKPLPEPMLVLLVRNIMRKRSVIETFHVVTEIVGKEGWKYFVVLLCWFAAGIFTIILQGSVRSAILGRFYKSYCYFPTCRLYLAPVPLSIFRSNSKFDEISKHSSVKYTRPITTIFCTRHDSVTVVTCAKYRCDQSSIFETRAF